MERIEVSTAIVNLSDIVKHVSRDQVTVELTEGQVPLARIVPIDKTHSMVELDCALRKSSGLGDDAEVYAVDVLSVRRSLGELDDPWVS